MRLFVAMAGLVFSLGAFAADGKAPGGPDFQEMKARALERIDRREAMLREHRACVEKAEDVPALKQCHESMRQKAKAHHGNAAKHHEG